MQADEDRIFALPLARYEQLDWAGRFMGQIDETARAAALSAFLPAFQERYLQVLRSPRPEYDLRIGEGDEALKALQQDGYALESLDPDHLRTLRDLVAPMAREMEARLETLPKLKFSDGQVVLDSGTHAAVYDAVETAFREAGVFKIFSAYAGRPLGLLRVALQVNTARETRLKYGDIDAQGLPPHKTSYMHVDSNDWPGAKALIYLSDVGTDQGPFRYVPGSHRLMGPFEAAVRKTNDKLKQRHRDLLTLPMELAQHANFGDYITEATPGAAALLEAERTVCDGRSDLVLFDNNGVHRGAIVREGRRVILQCHFWHESKIAGFRKAALASAETAPA